tara:strand:+ start:109 stop:213 length:105 start_codon:yes stop_codon:yes gene_type:complete
MMMMIDKNEVKMKLKKNKCDYFVYVCSPPGGLED